MKWFAALILPLLLLVQEPAAADEPVIILNNKTKQNTNNSTSSGVRIATARWLPGTVDKPMHADATYNAFSGARAAEKLPIGQYDFYYSLEIVPQFEKMSYSNCSNRATALNFLQTLFGVTTGAIIVVKTDVQYRWMTGAQVTFLGGTSGDAGLIAAGLGSTAPPATPGFGCFFDATLRPTFPLLQYGGGDVNDNYDDFIVKLIVIGGSAIKLSVVSNIVALFSDISAAAGWAAVVNPLAGPASQAAQKAASNFQDALTSAGTVQNQISVGWTLKANGDLNSGRRLTISIPDLFSADQDDGNLVMYVRRTGSIVLANLGKVVNLDTVLNNLELPTRLCNPASIASGSCNPTGTANITPLRQVVTTALKNIDAGVGDGTAITKKIIDMQDKGRDLTKVFSLCEGMRTVSIQSLHLSTLDEMMVRWAFTKEGGLQQALKDAGALPVSWPLPPGKAPTDGNALAKATGANSLADLAAACWNDGDQQTISQVIKSLGKTLAD